MNACRILQDDPAGHVDDRGILAEVHRHPEEIEGAVIETIVPE